MSGTRIAILIGIIPIVVGLLYLGLQLAFGQDTDWISGLISGTMDPAGVVMLVALGLAMAFGFAVILRGARDL
jgi:hypothetical protein